MAINKYKDHVIVLPEDDANRQLANGFLKHPNIHVNRIGVHPPSGGWCKVLEDFKDNHVHQLRKFPDRYLVLLIDFDGHVEERAEIFRKEFPSDISGRVFLLGTLSEPEPLRVNLGQSLEEIGYALAGDCADSSDGQWGHELLRHNQTELQRLVATVKPFLFQ